MKAIFTILFVFVWCHVARSQGCNCVRAGFTNSFNAPVTYLINEGFEEVDGGGALGSATDGYDSPLVTAETTAPNNDYATAPAPLVGTYSLFMDTTAPANKQTRWVLGSAETELHIFFMFSDATLPSNANGPIFTISDSGGNDQCYLYLRSDGTMQIFNGGTSATTVDSPAASTTYYVWVDWKTDGTAAVGFSTTGTKPTSGNKYASVTGGNGTTASVRLHLRADSGTGLQIIFDKFLVSTATIGSNP